ncbi:MAG: hypothetical protein AAF478_10455 [Pseudomonadota bacterium]
MRSHNNTGRSSGTFKNRKRQKINDPFVPYSYSMLQSPAFKALNNTDRKVLHRLEIEHLSHGGAENGNLICTYQDFVDYGVRRNSIHASLSRLEILGFIEIVERGRQARAEFRFPSRYRLTYVIGDTPTTNEWERFKDEASVERAIKAADKTNCRRR